MPHLSIISPVYCAENILDRLVSEIIQSISSITLDFEIILVEDGSPDNSWAKIEENCQKDPRVKGIQLSRNFGQHYAITAGLDQAQGEWIVVMDCDLQDKPQEISKLYNQAQLGYEVVLAKRIHRKDNYFKRFFSWAFYQVLSYLTGTKFDSSIANFGIYHQKVIQAICQMRESIRVFPIMVRWVGFKQIAIEVEHAPRSEGKSNYNFKRLFNLALDIILAYSDKPIRLTIKLGFLISFSAFIFTLITLLRYFMGIITVSGYASLIVSIWFFSGLIMMTLGVVGLYVGKTFEGVKERPIYIVKNSLNLPK